MKPLICVIIGCVMFFSCNNNQAKNELPVADTSLPIEESNDDLLDTMMGNEILHDDINMIRIDDDFYHNAIQKAENVIKNTEEFFLENFVNGINDSENFRYYVLNKFELSNSFHSYLIARDYTDECICWLANYDSNRNFIDAIEVFYINSEGYRSVNAFIMPVENTLMVNEYNIYENPEEQVKLYKIASTGLFEKTEN